MLGTIGWSHVFHVWDNEIIKIRQSGHHQEYFVNKLSKYCINIIEFAIQKSPNQNIISRKLFPPHWNNSSLRQCVNVCCIPLIPPVYHPTTPSLPGSAAQFSSSFAQDQQWSHKKWNNKHWIHKFIIMLRMVDVDDVAPLLLHHLSPPLFPFR